jgi:hypothetical protein
MAELLLCSTRMGHLRLIRGSVRLQSEDRPHRRATDGITEERFRYPVEEVWEVSCCTEEERQQPAPAPQSRAS